MWPLTFLQVCLTYISFNLSFFFNIERKECMNDIANPFRVNQLLFSIANHESSLVKGLTSMIIEKELRDL